MNHARWLALTLLLLPACADDAPTEPTPAVSERPIALDRQLVFVDAPNQRAYVLDLASARPKAESRRVELPPSAAVYERRAAHDEALILCSGRRGDAAQDAVPATLVSIGSNGQTRNYILGTTPFNALTQSDDGRFAIVYRSSSGSQGDGRTLDNPNELVVVDLDKAPNAEGAVTRKTPDGLAHTLTSVLVSPLLRIAEEDRRLLVVLSAAEVTLFDLNHLDRRATIVQLDETRMINPVQVVFSTHHPALYVRAQNSDNIFMFRFEEHDNDPLGNDFRPTVNPLSGGAGPRDMALFAPPNGERLLVVALQSSQVLVVDPSSSKTNVLALKTPAQRILLFKGRSPRDERVQTRALLYNDSLGGISFFDAEDASDNPEDRLEMLSTPSQVTSLIPLLDDAKVVLMQPMGVSLLHLEDRTLTPISSNTSLSAGTFDAERRRLWVGPASQPWVGTLDLETGKTDEIRLDAPIRTIVPMFAQDKLCVIHEGAIGYVTLVDLDHPDREHAISVRGFFVNNVLDRGAS